MARIMCTRKLWHALGHDGQPPAAAAEPPIAGVALGSWAVRLFHRDRQRLALALNDATYLTLVFRAAPRAKFRDHFAGALYDALCDLGVSSAAAGREAAVIDLLPLARLTNRRLIGSLNDLEFFAQMELDYVSDLRRVQRNLNDVPHANKPAPYVAAEAVAMLFSPDSSHASQRVH